MEMSVFFLGKHSSPEASGKMKNPPPIQEGGRVIRFRFLSGAE